MWQSSFYFKEFLIHDSRGFMILKNTNLLGLCHFRLIISKRVQRGTILICRHGQINPVELQQELVKKYLLLYQESQAWLVVILARTSPKDKWRYHSSASNQVHLNCMRQAQGRCPLGRECPDWESLVAWPTLWAPRRRIMLPPWEFDVPPRSPRRHRIGLMMLQMRLASIILAPRPRYPNRQGLIT